MNTTPYAGENTPRTYTTKVVAFGEIEFAIILPDEVLEYLGLEIGNDMEMEITDGLIIIRKAAANE